MLRADVQIMWFHNYPREQLPPDSISNGASASAISSEIARTKQRKTELSAYHDGMNKIYVAVRGILVAYSGDGSKIPQRPDDDSWEALTSETLKRVEMVRQLFGDLKQDLVLTNRNLDDLKTKLDKVKCDKTQAEQYSRNEIMELRKRLSAAEDEIHNQYIKSKYKGEMNKTQKTQNADSKEIENYHLLCDREITTQSTQTNELNNELQNELKRKEEDLTFHQSQIEDLSAKLHDSEKERSNLDKRVIELENQNRHMKQQLTTEREHQTSITIERTQLEPKLEELKEELTKRKLTSETNAERLQGAQNEISQLREQNNRGGDQFAIEELQERLAISESKLDHDRSIFEEQIKHLREELERTTKSLEEVKVENSKNVNRLAAEMNAKVSSDESSLENISIQARPMKIAEDYSQLMSGAWLDAKSELDDVYQDDAKEAELVQLLLDVLMVSEQEAKNFHTQILQELGRSLREPIIEIQCKDTTAETKASASPAPKTDQLPQNMLTVIGDYFRGRAGTVDLKPLQQRVISALKDKYAENEDLLNASLQIEDVNDYIADSVRIAWKMALQRPLMTFDTSDVGKHWTKDMFLELMWGSDPKVPDAVIQYYKTPKLLHAGKTMVKGSVFVHNELNPK